MQSGDTAATGILTVTRLIGDDNEGRRYNDLQAREIRWGFHHAGTKETTDPDVSPPRR